MLSSGCATVQPGGHRAPVHFPAVGINGDWLTVGGEKFLVVGVGYEYSSRPGQAPWKKKSEPDVMREDFRRIREAGFNTIRTWGPLSDEELELAAEYGLWVIQGLWIKTDADFNDPDFRRATYEFYEREVTRSAKHPNILFYLLLNEPHGGAVYRAGTEKMNEFFAEMVRVAKRCDPLRFFSYSNCISTDFMTPTMWDLTAQNVYPYSPATIDRCLGYRSYLDWVKRTLAKDKPLIITEHGLSVSPNGDGRGYGGNTLSEQRDGMIRMNEDWLAAGASGGCAFMWTDGWWKTGNENQHNPGAESWYGLLEVDSSYLGQPRPVYFSLKEFNKAIRTKPRDGQNVEDVFDVEVWSPGAARVQYRVDDRPWADIQRDGDWWWRGTASLVDAVDGGHYIWTRALDADGRPQGEKPGIVRLSHLTEAGPDPCTVRFVDLPPQLSKDTAQRVVVEVLDMKGQPVGGVRVRIDRFLNTGWNEVGEDVETDNQGRASATFPALNELGIVSIAAGTVYEEGLLRTVIGDYRHVELVAE
ncbi:MAG: glycoside hydrolase family 2 TIM barrel-domain containing protein [bacterium]